MSTHPPGVEKYIARGKEMQAALERAREKMRGKQFDTIAVHGVYNAEQALQNQGSIIEPAYLSASQHYENSDHMEAALAYLMPSWAYSRIANPTLGHLEETIALLEGYGGQTPVSTCVTSSGMSAIFMATTPFLEANPQSEPINIVASAKCYGGTFMLFNQRYGRERGIDIRWISNPLDLREWESRIDRNTRFLYGEMPCNPSLDVIDIPRLAELAHSVQLPLIVDATIATPALLRPIQQGADISVQSLSKTMASSGLAIAGSVSARHDITSRFGSDALKANFAHYIKLLPARDYGPNLSPFNALMVLNDLRTLRGKVDQLSQNAATVAHFLNQHQAVEAVYYPGLKHSPGHAVAKRQMVLVDSEGDINRYGHLLSFTVKGGTAAARSVLDGFDLIWRATDLGRIKSVATIPAISTHQQQGESGRRLAGLPGNLIRLSIGHEAVADIIDDLQQALAGAE